MDSIRTAYDALPVATGIVSEGQWMYANPALVALLGRKPCAADAIAPLTRWTRPDGSTIAVELATRPIDLDGRRCLVVAVSDLSACEALFDRLGRTEESFRELVDASPDAMFVHGDESGDCVVLWANPAMVRLLGYDSATELIGRKALETFVHPDDREALNAYRSAVRTRGSAPDIELRWITRDGRMLHMRGARRNVRFADAPAILVVMHDLTHELETDRERCAADAAIRESEARYRLLFDSSPLPIFLFDAETYRFVAVNAKTLELYGYSREEFLAMTVKDLKRPEDVAQMVRGIDASPVGTQVHVGVMKHHRKDGSALELDITSHQVELDGRKCSLTIGLDVTERRRIEEQLRQSQKMEAIGQLAGGIAHDFNNLLAVILATTSFLREEVGSSRAANDVAEIEAAAQRATALTRQLLAFSRKQPHTPHVLALRSVVENVEKMLRRIVGEDIELSSRFAPHGLVEADASQLEQVIMNLAVNARDAMPTGGRLTIETANVELDDNAAACIGVRGGSYMMLSVTDTGCGMDQTTKRRLFEPFFTTKGVGRGTGLGLATVFGIVAQSGGGITVQSELGRGSTFRVYLPRVDRDDASTVPPPIAGPPTSGSESILLVEDDAQLRSVISRRLHALGYRTIEASDAKSACDAIARTSARVDLLLTDLVMPGLDGRALASMLLAEHPELKVLFMSGYSEHNAVKTAALGTNDHFIEKPFTATDLSAAIRRALEAR